MADSLDELQNAEFKEAFDEFDKVKKIVNISFVNLIVVNSRTVVKIYYFKQIINISTATIIILI